MASEWKDWTIPGEVFQQALNLLPEEWTLSISVTAGDARPYVRILDEYGDVPRDGDGPNDGESLVDCIGRLVLLARHEGGDDDGE